MKTIKFISILIFSLISSSVCSQSKVQEWRGENRSGIYQETHLLKIWPENGPDLIWEFDQLGYGYGTPLVTNNRIYALGEIDSIGHLFALDLSGKLIWKKEYGIEWTKSFRGSRSTPTLVEDLLYVCSGFGDIYCFDAKTGDLKWTKSLKNDFDGRNALHGHSESLLVDKDKLFLFAGGIENNIVALNRFNGEIIWKNIGIGETSAYNSPQIIKLPNRIILVHFSSYALLGIDTQTGELLWTHVQTNVEPEKRKPGMGDTHSNTVIFEDENIYYVAGDGNGGVKLQLSKDGSSVKEIWRNPDFDSYMGGVLLIGNYLYSCGTAKPIFMCVDKNSGEIVSSLKTGAGAVIAADNLLYYYNQKGEVMLIDPNPTELTVISKFSISKGQKEHFAHPTIKNGVLYIRHGEVLMAYNIKEEYTR